MEIRLVVMTNLQNGIAMADSSFSANSFIKERLQSSILNVIFVKKNGDERRMRCTLHPDFLPKQVDLEEAVQKKTPNADTLAVWDLDKEAWRSFRYDSIIGFSEVQ
jgi:hypothetical protein